MTTEFEEISHSGGQVIFKIGKDGQGRRGYQITVTSDRPVPAAWLAIYALSPGIPVGTVSIGGIGQRSDPPPFANCYQVFIASDSEGKFGHNCPSCNGYWRSGTWANVCPYCAVRAEGFHFISEAQQRYVNHYCSVLEAGLATVTDGEIVIDMNEVADAAGKEGEKPAFYISDERQQCGFVCKACNEFNDILGRFGYCSLCGTRNDLADFEDQTIPAIRARLNSGSPPEDGVRDAVAAFDSFMAQIGKQFAKLIPMSERRRTRLEAQSFHNLSEVRKMMSDWFDVDLVSGMKAEEISVTERMFCRRHVYEHNGGEVDQRYIDNSGDTTVRLKQHIHETKEGAHDLMASLVKMARNVHRQFHELFPPIDAPIKRFEADKAWKAKHSRVKR